ncbi:hypothetical protein Bbelb_417380 [Branchiostoma belcheri]|nr:hypothetical protein Bbelb_417380 [Branchiostoma belcheri]
MGSTCYSKPLLTTSVVSRSGAETTVTPRQSPRIWGLCIAGIQQDRKNGLASGTDRRKAGRQRGQTGGLITTDPPSDGPASDSRHLILQKHLPGYALTRAAIKQAATRGRPVTSRRVSHHDGVLSPPGGHNSCRGDKPDIPEDSRAAPLNLAPAGGETPGRRPRHCRYCDSPNVVTIFSTLGALFCGITHLDTCVATFAAALPCTFQLAYRRTRQKCVAERTQRPRAMCSNKSGTGRLRLRERAVIHYLTTRLEDNNSRGCTESLTRGKHSISPDNTSQLSASSTCKEETSYKILTPDKIMDERTCQHISPGARFKDPEILANVKDRMERISRRVTTVCSRGGGRNLTDDMLQRRFDTVSPLTRRTRTCDPGHSHENSAYTVRSAGCPGTLGRPAADRRPAFVATWYR